MIPELTKTISNDALIKLLEEIDSKLFKLETIKYVKEKGLSFNQREAIETIAIGVASTLHDKSLGMAEKICGIKINGSQNKGD